MAKTKPHSILRRSPGGCPCYKYDCEAFVMNCTLSVNTSACLSRRRVSTGVFTNQTCAVNRKRSKVFITGADPRGAVEDAVGLFFRMVGIKGLSFHRSKIKETVNARLPLLEKVFCYLWGVRKMSFFPLFYQLFELWYTNQYTNSFSLHQLYKVQSLCYYYTTDAKKAP